MNKSSGKFELNLVLRFLLAAVGGTLYFLGFVGFDIWPLSWFCLVPLLIAIDGVSAKRGFFIGWFFGSVALTGGFYWVAYTVHVFAYMPWIVSSLVCLLLCVGQATEFALFGFLYSLIRKKTNVSPVLLATVAFVAAEFVSPQLFPHYLANSQYMNIPIIQISDVTGVAGVTALIVLVNASIYQMIHSFVTERRILWKTPIVATLLVFTALAYGYLRLPVVRSEMADSPKVRFGITQVNMGIYEKSRNPEKAIRLNREQTLELKKMGAEIVIWPETAVQAPVLSEGLKKLPAEVFGDIGIPILTGVLQRDLVSSAHPLYNAALLTDENGNITGSYKKQKLLTFGEYIPFGNIFPVAYKWLPYITRFTEGNSNAPLRFRDNLFNVNICYEEILPRFIRNMMTDDPGVMINITNDNWFGKTHEPIQHLVLAAFRSIEHRRWLVRSANTGISAFVDATGKIVDRTPLMEKAMLISDVPMMTRKTVYAKFGDWFAWVCVVFTLQGLIVHLKRRQRYQRHPYPKSDA